MQGLERVLPADGHRTAHRERVYVIVDLDLPPGGLASRLTRYPRYSVIPADGTWLGSSDAESALIGPAPGGPGFKPIRAGEAGTARRRVRRSLTNNPFCGKKVGEFIDAGLYLRQPGELTASWPNPAIYLDPVYRVELLCRNTLRIPVDLDWYRREHPVRLQLHNLDWRRSHECRSTPRANR